MTEHPIPAPETTGSVSPAWEIAVGRAAVYGFLSRSLLYPSVALRASTDAELLPLLASVMTSVSAVEAALHRVLEAYDADVDELRRAHGRVFTHIENPDCPAHESAFCPGDVFRRADVIADIAAFYCAQGLKVGGAERERADHIATELEFVSFLARKEAYAIEHLGPDRAAECRRFQELFLRDHLACWAPGLAERIQLLADHPFYRAIAALLGEWIKAECEWLGVEPSDERHDPQPLPEPDDGLCGVVAEDTPVTIGRVTR